ncbi:MAG: InlB B-repeat-containing protein [Huintestinicola sp.]
MNSKKIAIISAAAALILVIITLVVVNSRAGGTGLYISSVSGDVSVTRTDGTSENAAADMLLSEGDILTVNDGGSCTIIYRTLKNRDENYAVVESASQVFVSNEFDGKSDGELYLNRGSVLVSSVSAMPQNILVRTESTSVTTKESAVRVAYAVGETNSTSVASFMGNVDVQMYDILGNPVGQDGAEAKKPELLGSGLSGKIISGNPAPAFDYLNVPVSLSDYNADTLRALVTISAFDELAFSSQDIKAAYDAAAGNETETSETTVTETEPVTTEVTETTEPEMTETSEETSVTTTAPAPSYTTAYEPPATTAPPVTTTAAPQTTAGGNGELIPVYIFIEDEIIYQEVPYGGDAEEPAIPAIEGKVFVEWDSSFTNITSERTITAIFRDADQQGNTTSATTEATTTGDIKYYNVTIDINGILSTQQVPEGGTAVLPEVNVPGYAFNGWSHSPENITSDLTIYALLTKDPTNTGETKTYTVTFIANGISYPVSVTGGQAAVPPSVPFMDSFGQSFIGWNVDFSCVNSDLTVYAIYG